LPGGQCRGLSADSLRSWLRRRPLARPLFLCSVPRRRSVATIWEAPCSFSRDQERRRASGLSSRVLCDSDPSDTSFPGWVPPRGSFAPDRRSTRRHDHRARGDRRVKWGCGEMHRVGGQAARDMNALCDSAPSPTRSAKASLVTLSPSGRGKGEGLFFRPSREAAPSLTALDSRLRGKDEKERREALPLTSPASGWPHARARPRAHRSRRGRWPSAAGRRSAPRRS